jgi:hypothetical protein
MVIYRHLPLVSPILWIGSKPKKPAVKKTIHKDCPMRVQNPSILVMKPEISQASSLENREMKKERRKQTRANAVKKLKGKTILEEASVSQACLARYQSCWNRVSHLLLTSKGRLKNIETVDQELCQFLEEQYYEGEDISLAQYTVASVLFFNPSLKAHGNAALPRVKQSLKGWRKLCPTRSRMPVPWEVTCLLVQDMIGLGKIHLALHTLLMHTLYLRPSEALRLRHCDVVKPVKGRGCGYQAWTFVLHPMEMGIPSKTQEYDESLQLDLPYHQGIGDCLSRWIQKRQLGKQSKIFDHNIQELNNHLGKAERRLNLGKIHAIHAYRFRHGGASYDFVMKLRDLTSVQHRGRWKSLNSVRRYQKGARLAQLFGALPADVRRRCKAAANNLANTLSKVR